MPPEAVGPTCHFRVQLPQPADERAHIGRNVERRQIRGVVDNAEERLAEAGHLFARVYDGRWVENVLHVDLTNASRFAAGQKGLHVWVEEWRQPLAKSRALCCRAFRARAFEDVHLVQPKPLNSRERGKRTRLATHERQNPGSVGHALTQRSGLTPPVGEEHGAQHVGKHLDERIEWECGGGRRDCCGDRHASCGCESCFLRSSAHPTSPHHRRVATRGLTPPAPPRRRGNELSAN